MEAVIFDLDGTLIDYEIVSHESLQVPLKKLINDHKVDGIGLDEEEPVSWSLHARIIGRRALGEQGWAPIILQALKVPQEILTAEEYANQIDQFLQTKYHTLSLMPGAMELVSRIAQQKIPMAIATSSNRVAFEKKMQPYPGIKGRMKAIICGDDPEVKHGKPFPDIFLLAAKQLGLQERSLNKVVVFEDSPAGVEGARRAGMISIAIPDKRLFADEEISSKYSHASKVLRSLTEFTPEYQQNLACSKE